MLKHPLLAESLPDLDHLKKLQYPLVGSPKLDGLRIIGRDGEPLTKKFELIPNLFTRKHFSKYKLHGIDGEYIVGSETAKNVFNRSQSAAMTEEGTPSFKLHLFDCWENAEYAYSDRFLNKLVSLKLRSPRIVIHEFRILNNPEEVLAYEQEVVDRGYEGLMIRSLKGRYKQGRSTVKEAIIFKVKRFKDIECKVLAFHEQQINNNKQTLNALGYAKRSSHKKNMVGAGTLGAMTVKDLSGTFAEPFRVSGKTDVWNQDVWDNQEKYKGNILIVKYQPAGVKDAPRFPVAKDWRLDY